MYELAKRILDETDGRICKNCLGRKLSKTIDGENNIERAEKVCGELGVELNGECVVCDNLFDKLNDDLYKKIDNKINQLGIEFDTFLVGCQIDKDIQKRDEELSEKFGLTVETIKKEVNRLIGLGIWERYDKEAEFERQDIVFNVNLKGNPKVKIQINPLYIEGKYNKFKRGIPQTKWPCSKCKGRGCEECNFTGKQYPESVEELISEHFLELTKGREAKFHGAGLTVQRRADASLAGDSVDCGVAVIYIYVITMNIVLRAVQGRMGAYLTRDGLLGRGTLMGAMVSHTYSLSFMG